MEGREREKAAKERVVIEGVVKERDMLKGMLNRLKAEGPSCAVAGGNLSSVN